MPANEQLEIISPSGEITFFELDPRKGVANVGRHPDNDIVIDAPGVAPFHALLDCNQRPYRLMLLSAEGGATLHGETLSPNASVDLNPWDSLEVGGYTVILLDNAVPAGAPPPPPPPAAAPRVPVQSAPGVPATIPPPPTEVPVRRGAPFPDQTDDVVIVDLSEREWTIDVEQSATCLTSITNGGDIVASFYVHVEGVPQGWVVTAPAEVNLNEGERATVTVSITPPRHPSSRAGTYPIAVIVASSNYPGHVSQRSATLTLNPYYEFAVGELSPREQTVGWRDPTGEVTLNLVNKGNSDATFRLDGTDDRRVLNFEFEVPGEDSRLARQAEMRLPPEQTFGIPTNVTSTSRPLFGLHKQRHPYTISVAMVQGEQSPRALMGELHVRPLIGPILMAFLALVLGLLIILIFRPKIHSFTYRYSGIIYPGETITLAWEASPFTQLVIQEDWLESGGSSTVILGPDERQRSVNPQETTRYTLIGNNILSRIIQFLEVTRQLETLGADGIVHVGVLYAAINEFDVMPSSIVEGETVTVFWDVADADAIELLRNGVPVQLAEGQVQYTDAPVTSPTIYTLRVRSNFSDRAPDEWDEEMARDVIVRPPTATPLPQPSIVQFDVSPREVYAGKSVTITWEVDAESVLILGGPEPVASNSQTGYEVQTLPQPGTFSYRLTATYADNTGQQDPTISEEVIVVRVLEPPTPTPAPVPPTITSFEIVPVQVTQGGSAQLVWSVSGEMVRMDISYATQGNVIFAGTNKSGSFPAPHVDTVGIHTYILTVYDANDEATSQTKVLTVIEPPPPPTATPLPLAVTFEAQGLRPGVDVVTPINVTVNSRTYSVAPGTKVKLTWQIDNADTPEVTISRNGTQIHSQVGPTGIYEDTDAIYATTQYQLHAEYEGLSADALVSIVPLDLDVPPPPYDVDGALTASNTLSVTWKYTPPENVYAITGFVVWRAPDPYTLFTPVAETTDTACDPQCGWEDTVTPNCGYAYYITAIYLDRYGDRQETEPSAERFYSGPCPTPTP
ncbi:MAG: FHA domain-containing protein [Anaerolineae bacterium]|nr:FHA domain-containing protein [Anaerolineae bacterium]